MVVERLTAYFLDLFSQDEAMTGSSMLPTVALPRNLVADDRELRFVALANSMPHQVWVSGAYGGAVRPSQVVSTPLADAAKYTDTGGVKCD